MPYLDHIGIAVDAPAPVLALYDALLGLHPYKQETVAAQGVRTHFLPAGTAKLELLEALAPDTAVGRFLERRGAGLHHVAFAVDDVQAAWDRLARLGYEPLGEGPRHGADGKLVFFLHPRRTHGVLIEFCQHVEAPLTPTFVPGPAGRLAAYRLGAPERPACLLLHAPAGTVQHDLHPLMRRLEPYVHVLAFDLPGHGASGAAGAFTCDALAEAARAVLDFFELPSAHLVGLSATSAVALHLAHQTPERVDRLAVYGAMPAGEALADALAPAAVARTPDRAAHFAEAHGADRWRSLCRALQAWIRTLPAMPTAAPHPTLVAAGAEDPLCPPEAALRLRRVLPDASLALLPDAGHSLGTADLDLITALLRRHLGA